MERDKSFLLSPVVFAIGISLLALTWAVMEPAALHHAFDNDGRSPFELATIPFFAAIVPLVWWKCPFTGSARRRALLCAAVSCVAFFAVCKELDLHLAAMHALFPDIVNADGGISGLTRPDGSPLTGTPFKMRFLTNGAVPLSAKAFVLFYFSAFFGVFAALLAYFAKDLVVGFFRLHPVAWSVCCLGGSGVMVQLCDRMPAWMRHLKGLPKDKAIDGISSFFTAFEEGGEMMIAVFALIAILQAHRIYNGNR
ncbi:MAG: hypothetical protein ACI4Q3_08970 [Kiritimatiellia bacterium]